MKVQISAAAAPHVVRKLKGMRDPAIIKFRDDLEKGIASAKRGGLLTAEEATAVVWAIASWLGRADSPRPLGHQASLESAFPKLQQLAERLNREE